MTRRLATALASAALFAFISAPTATSVAQTGATPRTGEKTTKAAQSSCPVHPDVKARTPGKCPKCRMEDRKQKEAQQKEKDKQKEQGGEAVNE